MVLVLVGISLLAVLVLLLLLMRVMSLIGGSLPTFLGSCSLSYWCLDG